jgi:tellurite resistance protein TerB
MAFFDQLKSRTQEMSSQLKSKAGQFKNKEFANGSMAMCALVAAADGSIDASERQKTAGLIMSNDVLSIFPPNELREKFDFYCDKLTKDYDFGKVEAIASISRLKSKPDQARAVIQIGIIIGGSDGNFDDDEKKAVKEACFAVGIPPAEFDL